MPNDPKLSDCGGRRAGCGKAAGAGWAKAAGWCVAASVTPGAVRCSAWLGVAVELNGDLIKCWVHSRRRYLYGGVRVMVSQEVAKINAGYRGAMANDDALKRV